MKHLKKAIWRIRSRRYRVDLDRHLVPTRTHRLGTAECGWRFVESSELFGSTIISCGLGEDASFDVEFATRYGAQVVIVDPTPTAVEHFNAITARLGTPAEIPYRPGGRQDPASYDLSRIQPGQLRLVERAVWTEETRLKFYLPPDSRTQVSHSLINYQNNYSTETPSIEVETTTLPELLEMTGDVPLLKLDIEGAEVPVILDMLLRGIHPPQLLVEFDELNIPSKVGRKNFDKTTAALVRSGYRMAQFDGTANFLFTKFEG